MNERPTLVILERPTRIQQRIETRAAAKTVIAWLDNLDPGLLRDADLFGEQLMCRATRLYEWAQERQKRRNKNV
jgi:hypothetical protein